MNFTVDQFGYFGEFGGAFVPEMLHDNLEQLRASYRPIIESASFQEEFKKLLSDFAGRPSPLYFAHNLSRRYGGSILLKREDLNHTGSHKINNALGQALLAKALGKTRLIAETGAGQHGVATATVAALFGFSCVIYMGELDIKRQAPNVARMKMLGAEVIPVQSGSRVLKDATNEALRDWITHPDDTYYLIGSAVGPHPYPDMVSRFQSVISEELVRQLREQFGLNEPTTVLACVGGGSNAIGGFYHFLSNPRVRLIGAEAGGKGLASGASAASIALGHIGVLHGSKTLVLQTPDGQIVEAHSVSAGLDYPGVGPQHAQLHQSGRVQYLAINDDEALRAGTLLAQLEGIIPALETAHALACLEKLALTPNDAIVVILSGRGDKDLETYGHGGL